MSDPQFPTGPAGGHPTDASATSVQGGFVAQPGILSLAQLASLQQTVLLSLPWRCDVLKDAETPDGSGGEADTPSIIATYACDIEPMQPIAEAAMEGKLLAVGLFLVTLPWNAVIDPKEHLIINNVTYKIENRSENLTDQACVQVFVRRVE